MKQISVDIPSHLLLRFLDYANEGILRNDIDEELITLASKVRFLNFFSKYGNN
jgi:hypothetical protein